MHTIKRSKIGIFIISLLFIMSIVNVAAYGTYDVVRSSDPHYYIGCKQYFKTTLEIKVDNGTSSINSARHSWIPTKVNGAYIKGSAITKAASSKDYVEYRGISTIETSKKTLYNQIIY